MGGTAQMIANEDFVDALGRIDAIQSRIAFRTGAASLRSGHPRTGARLSRRRGA